MPAHIGVQVAGTTLPAEVGASAAEAERLGYGEVWLAEDYFDLGGIASAATALASTREIGVGLGIVSIRARHPAVTAMEFATLGGAFPGRFMAGLGHGVTAWLEQMRLRPASPLRALGEGSRAVRRLLEGEELSEAGEYGAYDHVRLRFPPERRVPLYFGVHGPRSLELSGEVADGTLLGWFSSPEYVAYARERVDAGRARAGRSDRHALVALCVLSISDDDPAGARTELAEWASWFLAGMSESPEMQATEVGRELAAAVKARPSDEPVLAAELLDHFMAAGDTATCEAMVGRLLDAGADRVVLVPNPAGLRSTDAMVDQMRRAAALVG